MNIYKEQSTGYQLLAGLKILVLEDELDNLTLLSYILQVEGAGVIVANSVSEAVNQLQCQLINVALISIKAIEKYISIKNINIADIEIPKYIPKIAMVDSVRHSDWRSIRDLGCCACLSKPFYYDQIAPLIIGAQEVMELHGNCV
ncbi:PAS/PAC sensor hybrid histidine kinase [Calothrix sp. NIES-4071]|nr:PAS/PAC sensor hybrid histidine kinase [Calothrix sp. NIES-4071]BAZ60497.1 PAS/PAC sensor hybrid histidine kinase [Calothrix sp. NIES-4105]